MKTDKADVQDVYIDSRNRNLRLRAGAKGTGKVLFSVLYWPDSPRSEEKAYDLIHSEANRLGLTLTQHEPNNLHRAPSRSGAGDLR